MKLLVVVGAAGLVAACAVPPEPQVDADAGKKLFADNCAACHGADARGGGPESLGLGVVPPDLTTLTKRAGGTFPELKVMGKIDGYSIDGHRTSAMPEFGASGLGPTVVVEQEDGTGLPIPADLIALVAFLKTVQR